MTLRMHAERTADPQVVEFVVRDLPAYADIIAPGRNTSRDPGGLPAGLAALLDAGSLDEIVVMGERVACRRAADGPQWSELAAQCAGALAGALTSADHARRLRAAMIEGVGQLASSHGGSITVVAADLDRVAVRMAGACDGCPAASSTLLNGLRADMERAGLGGARVEVV